MKIGVFTKRISPYEPWTFAKVTGIIHELIMKIGENQENISLWTMSICQSHRN